MTKIAGAGNFRSLGGLRTRDGLRIRPNFLMRSDRLCDLTEADWEALAATGLRTIVDLRSRQECEQHPNCIPDALPIRQIDCNVRNDLRGDQSLIEMLVAEPSAAGAERLMIEIYRRFPQHMAPVLTRVVDIVLAGGAPLLIHCTAGKDRTGFSVAMLLHALGVSRDEIERDYLLSRGWSHAPIHATALGRRLAPMLPAGSAETVVRPLLDVLPSYLEASFEVIHNEYGSPERYLESACGLGAEKLAELRALALEGCPAG